MRELLLRAIVSDPRPCQVGGNANTALGVTGPAVGPRSASVLACLLSCLCVVCGTVDAAASGTGVFIARPAFLPYSANALALLLRRLFCATDLLSVNGLATNMASGCPRSARPLCRTVFVAIPRALGARRYWTLAEAKTTPLVISFRAAALWQRDFFRTHVAVCALLALGLRRVVLVNYAIDDATAIVATTAPASCADGAAAHHDLSALKRDLCHGVAVEVPHVVTSNHFRHEPS